MKRIRNKGKYGKKEFRRMGFAHWGVPPPWEVVGIGVLTFVLREDCKG